VWLFGLDGKLPPAQPGQSASRQAAAPAPTAGAVAAIPAADAASLERGRQLYRQACAVCHADDGKGEHAAGAPLVGIRDVAATIRTVTGGRNNMPPFGATFTAEQIRDVAGYVVEVLAGAAAK
jgi:mono/diheme cytochrome c family protein